MNPNFKAKFEAAIEAFAIFDARNDDCTACPFYEEECSGDGDKNCLCSEILELLKVGYQLAVDKEG